MNDKPQNPVPDPLLASALKNALEQSTQDLDAETLRQLREARLNALDKKKTAISPWAWPAMTAVAALAALVILPGLLHAPATENDQAKIILEMNSDDEIASVDDMEMLEDMDMIQALAEEVDNEHS